MAPTKVWFISRARSGGTNRGGLSTHHEGGSAKKNDEHTPDEETPFDCKNITANQGGGRRGDNDRIEGKLKQERYSTSTEHDRAKQ